MKYLYQNEDGFKVERKIGYTWYYCEVLKEAIERYGLTDMPDYEELIKIFQRIEVYMESSRYIGALGAPIYVETTYASDVMQIRRAILGEDYNRMPVEKIQEFFKIQIERLDEASERHKSLLWSS
ncbi:MAG: hypothetical protein ACFE9R_15995 [Candidatus Hermodarchaeota archaeon]